MSLLKQHLKDVDIALIVHITAHIVNAFYVSYSDILSYGDKAVKIIPLQHAPNSLDNWYSEINAITYPLGGGKSAAACEYCSNKGSANYVSNRGTICQECYMKIYDMQTVKVGGFVFRCTFDIIQNNLYGALNYCVIPATNYVLAVKYGYCELCDDTHGEWKRRCRERLDILFNCYVKHCIGQYWIAYHIDIIDDIKPLIVARLIAALDILVPSEFC